MHHSLFAGLKFDTQSASSSSSSWSFHYTLLTIPCKNQSLTYLVRSTRESLYFLEVSLDLQSVNSRFWSTSQFQLNYKQQKHDTYVADVILVLSLRFCYNTHFSSCAIRKTYFLFSVITYFSFKSGYFYHTRSYATTLFYYILSLYESIEKIIESFICMIV